MTTLDPGVTGRRSGGRTRKIVRGQKARAPPKAPPQAPLKVSPEAPLTMSVPEAGRKYFGLSKNASYDAVARGDIPVVRVGKLLRVPVRAMERILDEVGTASKLAQATA
jgi:hypothetical protein